MPTESNKIIDMVFEIMREKNISQTELSNRLHWTKSKLSKVLNGTQRLTTDDLYDFSAALGIANPAILMKADIDAVDDKLWSKGQIIEAMKMFTIAEDYADQRSIIENKIAPIFSSYLSLMTDGRVARAKDNRMMFNTASRQRFVMKGEEIPIHWGVMVRDLNPLVDKTNRLTLGIWWNGKRDVAFLAIVLKEYVSYDGELIESFHHVVNKDGGNWSMEKKVEEIPYLRRGLVCYKTFEVSELNDELTFKSELLSAYNLYADLVEHYMNMVMHGFTASRKESVEVSKAAEMRTAVTIRNNAMALKKAGYQCEANSNHTTFINPNTGKNFMQAMHLIPISAQNNFNVSLDIPANVCCLCPNCAALLHHGSDSDRQEMLMQLYMKHKPDLEEAGISITLMELFKANGME